MNYFNKTINMKLIKTDLYLLFIDEEAEIKKYFKGYVYQPHLRQPIELEDNFIALGYAEEDRKEYGGGKILAYYPLSKEAEELDLPLLPNPFNKQIDEVAHLKNLGHECFIQMKKLNPSGGIKEFIRMAVEFGYKAAQSHSKQFNLEDVVRIVHLWDNHINIHEEDKGSVKTIEKFIQSLSTQKLPSDFIPEYEEIIVDKLVPKMSIDIIKTITNSEGKEVLVGIYRY